MGIKSYTDIEQSRKLAEILPLESADMFYQAYGIYGKVEYYNYPRIIYNSEDGEEDYLPITSDDIPCWSLAALLVVLPKSLIYTPNPTLDGYSCKNIMHDFETYGDNPIDACYEMILKLHKQNLI